MKTATRPALHSFLFLVLLFRFETHSWSQITTDIDQSINSIQKENERLKREIEELKNELEKIRKMPDGVGSAGDEKASEMRNKELTKAIVDRHQGEITSQKSKVTSLELQMKEVDQRLREIQKALPQNQQVQITEYISKLTSLDAEVQRIKAKVLEKIPGDVNDKDSIKTIDKIIHENDKIIKRLESEVSVLEKVPSEFIAPTEFAYKMDRRGHWLTLLKIQGNQQIPLPGQFINMYEKYFDGPEKLLKKIQTDSNGIAQTPLLPIKDIPKNTWIVFRFGGDKLLQPCEKMTKWR
jgi:hypothetical protein